MTRCAGDGYGRVLPAGDGARARPGPTAAATGGHGHAGTGTRYGPCPLGARVRVRRQRMWRPEIARAMTRRWISLVPSKMV